MNEIVPNIKNVDYSTDLEDAIVGACMLETSAPARAYSILKPEYFYSPVNAIIWGCISDMFKAGVPIDILTVLDWYQNHCEESPYMRIYEAPYLITKTTNAVCSSAHLEYHCAIIERMYKEREIRLITSGAVKLEGNIEKQLSVLNSELQRLASGNSKQDWHDMTELMLGLYQHQDEMVKTGGVGLITGVTLLDKLNGGFHNGQLIVIGARPSVGKTAFLGQMALGIAGRGKHVGIVSLEMGNSEIAGRLAAIDTDIDFKNIYRSLWKDEEEHNQFLKLAGQQTAHLPIWVSEKTGVNVTEIRAKAAQLKAREGCDILFIDYLQLVSGESSKNRNRENEVAEMSRGCKIMAKELGIPVVILCQLNRASTARKGNERYPQLSDLRESGAIEQDADVVMFLHRDWVLGEAHQVDENGSSTEFDADLLVRKWRNGELCHIKFDFDGKKMKFTERQSSWQKMPQQTLPDLKDYSAPAKDFESF